MPIELHAAPDDGWSYLPMMDKIFTDASASPTWQTPPPPVVDSTSPPGLLRMAPQFTRMTEPHAAKDPASTVARTVVRVAGSPRPEGGALA